ncbi:putative NBD/HSP70 family sugar kinase [Kutzneria kofuensis]|uniref:Putative NBD/HSP70 family sugar kinase n=2 Tax=Kutzneria kofuensis TaxID=103725 RepID=A0A7W9KK71_9PSEU|nr:putative NBD/HSP70 family sugar kinase [Kutzneria kofuensis]
MRAPQVGTPASMRELNQRIVLDRLRRGGAATRPSLARDTGLSKPTVGQALLDLEQDGLVRPAGRTSAGPGRSAVLYEADPAAGHVLGIDIGRGRLRLAVADLAGTVVAKVDEPNRCRSASALVRTVQDMATGVVGQAGMALSDVVLTVVGSPGVPDRSGRMLHLAPNLPGWGRRGLLDELEAVLGPNLLVENDANLAAVGERDQGAARGVDVFVCVNVGTGIGMGIVVDGQLFRGAHGAAGEVGYLPYGWVDTDSEGWTPATPGMLEQAAAANSVVKLAKEQGVRNAGTAREVFQLARQGDPGALAVVEQEATRLAFLVASVSAVIDPELVLLVGGIGSNTDLLIEPLEKAMHEISPLSPRIAPGELGEDAVLTGAIATGLRAAQDIVFERRGENLVTQRSGVNV